MKYNFLMSLALSKSTARHIAVWKVDTYDDARTEQCVKTRWRSDGVRANGSSFDSRENVRLVGPECGMQRAYTVWADSLPLNTWFILAWFPFLVSVRVALGRDTEGT
jgi:hypothetical protein